MRDETKEFGNPYALLEFTYSDGFILKEDNTGNSIWYSRINHDFEWVSNKTKLTIKVKYPDNSIREFEYEISELDNNSMIFLTPKGNKYFMIKQ